MKISVVIPTHNPHPDRLRRTLEGLRAQTLPADQWACVLVDNGSQPALTVVSLRDSAPRQMEVASEPALGLTPARKCGISTAAGDVCVLVDDDNVLAPDYLAAVRRHFEENATIGAIGGKSIPEFETPPAPWLDEFSGLLAIRDLGDAPIISTSLINPESGRREYPACAPIGAGMAFRRAAIERWLASTASRRIPDRRGKSLSSSGDNDMVLSIMESGWHVAYFPDLRLTHLIPSARLEADYLARLNRGIQRSWVVALRAHGIDPWPTISRASLPLRAARSYLTHGAWKGPRQRIRWAGALGRFEGCAHA